MSIFTVKNSFLGLLIGIIIPFILHFSFKFGHQYLFRKKIVEIFSSAEPSTSTSAEVMKHVVQKGYNRLVISIYFYVIASLICMFACFFILQLPGFMKIALCTAAFILLFLSFYQYQKIMQLDQIIKAQQRID